MDKRQKGKKKKDEKTKGQKAKMPKEGKDKRTKGHKGKRTKGQRKRGQNTKGQNYVTAQFLKLSLKCCVASERSVHSCLYWGNLIKRRHKFSAGGYYELAM